MTFKCDLDYPLTWNVSNEQLCQIILKSMHKYKSYSLDNLNLWPFYHLIFKCDLDLLPTWSIVSNEPLCRIILKSMQNCRSYGLYNLHYGHFIIWPSSVTLTFNLPEQMFQMNNCDKLLWNPCINVEVMAWTNLVRCTHACTHNVPTYTELKL